MWVPLLEKTKIWCNIQVIIYKGITSVFFSDNIDEEVPDELPDITEDKPKPVDKKSAKKKEDKKPPPKKPEVVKQKSKPTVVEPMPVVSKPAAKKNKKTVVEETLGKYKTILVKSNQMRVCLSAKTVKVSDYDVRKN